MRRRVVITGLGVISSIGIGVEEFSSALKRGESGISRITAFDTKGFPYYYAGQVREYDKSKWVRRLNPNNIGRSSNFAIASSHLAIEDSGISQDLLKKVKCGVCIGTTDGESQVIEQINQEWVKELPINIPAGLFNQVPPHQISSSVAHELQLRGEILTISTACAAGNYAVGHGFDLISTGKLDYMLCGGVDSLSRKTFTGFFRLGSIAPFACQPFDKNRLGLITGEGAGMLFLETVESAVSRGATIYAEILGYGLSCDASHMTAPNLDSIVTAIKRAHSYAGVQPEEVDYISAHGTGTKLNDAVEAKAIKTVFNNNLPPVSSIKSMIGHTMGAASAISLVACSIALKQGFIPPTINHLEDDPELGIDCVPNHSRNCNLNVVQNNAFAFGGNNAIVLLRRYE
jgi:3-oxoacyl-[acyl-carrier-protein] synthase II